MPASCGGMVFRDDVLVEESVVVGVGEKFASSSLIRRDA